MIYDYTLTTGKGEPLNLQDYKGKVIIDREGSVVARFEPTADMEEVEACVKTLL